MSFCILVKIFSKLWALTWVPMTKELGQSAGFASGLLVMKPQDILGPVLGRRGWAVLSDLCRPRIQEMPKSLLSDLKYKK